MSVVRFDPRLDAWFPAKYLDNPVASDYLNVAERIYGGEFSENDWENYYSRKLREIIVYLKENSLFYCEKLKDVNPNSVEFSKIRNLPFTTKDDIRKNGNKVLSMKLNSGTVYYETTGTTGKPLQTPRSWFEAFVSNYHFSRNMAHLINHQFRNEKPIVGILGPTEVHSLGDAIGDVFRNIDVSHVKFWPYSPKIGFKRASEIVSDVGVNVLFGTPAVILPMIRYAKELGSNYAEMREVVKTILILGEVTSPAMRTNLSALYGGAVCQPGAYGGTELFVASSSCGYGRMHFSKQNYISEILDPWTQEAVPRGKVGELVLTFLLPGIRPLVRYRSGDLVSAQHHRCACGNPAEIFTNHGRVSDIVQLAGTHFFASEIEQMIMEDVAGFFGYQVTIDAEAGGDRLHIDLEPIWDSSELDEVETKIQKRVAERLGIPVSVSIVERLPPAVNTGGFITWKSARVNDLRVPADTDRAAAVDLAARWLNGYTPELGNA